MNNVEFFRIVNAEHGIYELTEEAAECSRLAKVKRENRRISTANKALIKFSGIMALTTIVALIIK